MHETTGASSGATSDETPLVVVSCDSHVGPRLEEDLRPYCPASHLERFDDFVARHRAARQAEVDRTKPAGEFDDGAALFARYPEMHVAGHHDVHARLRDMDRDGVAAEVIYHFSQNGEPLPLVENPAGGLGAVPTDALDLGAAGYRIYNRWLADFVSVEPERHIGLAYLPTWDIDAAVAELEWAHGAGLRGVNFPPPGRPGHLEYNNPAWEPFWSACEAFGMSLNTHSGNAAAFDYFGGPGGQDILIYECGGWMARRAVWWMIHGQVFERHPELKLVITEQYEGWWTNTLAELDAVYSRFGQRGRPRLAKLPSEYMRTNVYLGASFPSTFLAQEACREGYAANVLWGRDYPHVEGTFHVEPTGDGETITRLSLRHVLSQVPPREARLIAGDNAVRAFGLDGDALAAVAARIDAPSLADLARPIGVIPEVRPESNAFRGQAGLRPLGAPTG